MKCLDCETELTQIPKKRQKQFCNSTCRSNYWQKKQRKKKEPKKQVLTPPPPNMNKIDKMLWEAEQEILNQNKK